MPPTINDVARAAQVSTATVSFVLNGKPGISDETRAKVFQAAAELNYTQKPGRAQREIQTKSLRFLKISKHGRTVNRDHNVFISDYIDGMSGEASRLGYNLEIVSFESVPIDSIVASLANATIDGAIVLGTELSEADLHSFHPLPIPFVVIDTFYDFVDCNFINMNNKDAVFQILTHFVTRGFKRIGLVASNVETTNFHLRRTAFIEGMRRLGLPFDEASIISVDSTYQGAYEDMRSQLKSGLELPDCYFCTNDIITYGCIKALQEFKVRIPEDVSVIGFDNLPMSETMTPPLTTVEVSKEKMGHLSVKLLDEQINAAEKAPAVKTLVGARLIERASVASKSDVRAIPTPAQTAAQP